MSAGDYRSEPLGDDADAEVETEVDAEALRGPQAHADEPAERRRFIVAAALHGQRLDRAVVGLAPEFSRNHLQSLIEEGHVEVDGSVARTPARRVRAGQAVEVELVPPAESLAFRAEAIDLAVVHEDADVLVIDKPAGMVVHPAAGNWSGTLLNGLLAHHAAAASLPRAGIVHRLDKDTSGLLVVGKSLPAVTSLGRQIADRSVGRQYRAIVHGEVEDDAFRIEAPIGRDPVSRVRMAIVAAGRPARTDVRCVLRSGGCSVVECRLHTGRTHQIRVHLAARGHPLVADTTYGGHHALGLVRQALHAERLAFDHPSSGARLEFGAALPADLAGALGRLAAATPGR